jgi:hypothetical protein
MKTNEYPAWRYGPNGQSQIFQSPADVPAGWQDHPSKVSSTEKAASKPKTGEQGGSTGNQGSGGSTGDKGAELDAHGHPWDAKLHAATRAKTTAGLWRMKVGAARPPPAEGFPKPVLDL